MDLDTCPTCPHPALCQAEATCDADVETAPEPDVRWDSPDS